MTAERYPSVPERITWTTGFRLPIDKHVLGVLSTFANFRTGKCARMSITALTMRAGVNKRTVHRALARLQADGWVTATRWHRHATSWDINTDRLATNWVGAKVVSGPSASDTNLTDTGVTQTDQSDKNLSDTGDTLSDTDVTQTANLSDTGVTPIPCTFFEPQVDHKEPALRAVPIPDAGRPPPPDAESTEHAKAKVEPQQLTFGPQEVDPSPPDDVTWKQRFADLRADLRSRLKKHG